MCCHIECAEFKVRAALSGTKCNQGQRPQQTLMRLMMPPFIVLSLLFFSPLTEAEGLRFILYFFIFSVACAALIYFFPLTLCVAAAPCLKDEREDLLSHDTWRGGRKHSRDEDETVGADVPVLNVCTSSPAILQSVKMTECLRLFFQSWGISPIFSPAFRAAVDESDLGNYLCTGIRGTSICLSFCWPPPLVSPHTINSSSLKLFPSSFVSTEGKLAETKRWEGKGFIGECVCVSAKTIYLKCADMTRMLYFLQNSYSFN